jgi:hypothetical protein
MTRIPFSRDSATFSAAWRHTAQDRNSVSVELPRRRGDAEVGDRRTGRREAQLGVIDQVADHGDDGVACHEASVGL